MGEDALRPGGVAVVTGGGSGIGEGLARAFAARGLRVAVADVRADTAEEVAGRIRAAGGEASAHAVDVADYGGVEALAAAVTERWGGTQVLVNNAGVTTQGLLWNYPPELWRTVMGVNVDGVFHGIRAFLPAMLESGRAGHVVNTASMAGLMAAPNTIPYTAGKHAVLALTESLYAELRGISAPIGASVLIPSAVRTAIMDNSPQDEVDAGATASLARTRERLAGGLDPAVVAELVLAGIAADDLWIHTSPEIADQVVRARMTALLTRTPVPPHRDA